MKKKIILGIILAILMTGCSAKYNIVIKDGKINEELTIKENDLTIARKENEIGESFEKISDIYGNEYDLYTSFYDLYADEGCISCETYDKQKINDNNEIGFSLNHTFELEKYSDSTLANEYLQGFQSTFDGQYLTIKGNNPSSIINSYEDLTEITISIESNYRVISSNGKKIGNTYTWEITPKKHISELYIIVDTTKETVVENNNSLIYIIVLVITLIVFGVLYLLVRKNRIKNAI